MNRPELTPKQAFAAMFLFLERYDARTSGNGEGELGTLLGDLQLNPADGRSCDPAAWADWLAAIDDVLEREQPGSMQK
jgi:hypothetical protein